LTNTTDNLSPNPEPIQLDNSNSYCVVRVVDGELEIVTNFLTTQDFMDIMNVVMNTDAILDVSCEEDNIPKIKRAIKSLKPQKSIMLPSDTARMKTI